MKFSKAKQLAAKPHAQTGVRRGFDRDCKLRRRLLAESLEQRCLLAFDAPQVANLIVNEGAEQRSDLTSIELVFDSLVDRVDVSTNPFSLTRTEDGASVPTNVTWRNIGDLRTSAVLRWADGPMVAQRSYGEATLLDGTYELVVDAGQIENEWGIKLDGNADGVAGDNFVYEGSDLYRSYGDANGNQVIDLLDFSQFRAGFGTGLGDAQFDSHLDSDGDGHISLLDFGQFRKSFGDAIPTAIADDIVVSLQGDQTTTVPVFSRATGFDLATLRFHMIDGVEVQPGDVVTSSSGSLTVNADGTLSIESNSTFDGYWEFTYTLSDDTVSATGHIRFNTNPNIDVITIDSGQNILVDVFANDAVLGGPGTKIIGFGPGGASESYERFGISAEIVGNQIEVAVAPGAPTQGRPIAYQVSQGGRRSVARIRVQVNDPDATITTNNDFVSVQAGTFTHVSPLENDLASHGPIQIDGVSTSPTGSFSSSIVEDGLRVTIQGDDLVVAATSEASGIRTIYYSVTAGTTDRSIGELQVDIETLSSQTPFGTLLISGDSTGPAPSQIEFRKLYGPPGEDPQLGTGGDDDLHFPELEYEIIDGRLEVDDNFSTAEWPGFVAEIEDWSGSISLRSFEVEHHETSLLTRLSISPLSPVASPVSVSGLGSLDEWTFVGIVDTDGVVKEVVNDGLVEIQKSGNRVSAELVGGVFDDNGIKRYSLQLEKANGQRGWIPLQVTFGSHSTPKPIAIDDHVVVSTGQTSVPIDLLTNDSSGIADPEIQLADPPILDEGTFGDLHWSGSQYNYVRKAVASFGTDTFTYEVANANGARIEGTLTVTTTEPTIVVDPIDVMFGGINFRDLLANDLVPAGYQLLGLSDRPFSHDVEFTPSAQVGSIELSVVSGGLVEVASMPLPPQVEPATFYYGLVDPQGNSYFGGEVHVTTLPHGGAPTGNRDSVLLAPEGWTQTIDVLANDLPGEFGEPLHLFGVSVASSNRPSDSIDGAYGYLVIEDNQLVYHRSDGVRSGIDEFAYYASDSAGHVVRTEVEVSVTDSWLVDDQLVQGFQLDDLLIDVVANDSLPDGFVLAGVSDQPNRIQAGTSTHLDEQWGISVEGDQLRFQRVTATPGTWTYYYSVAHPSGVAFGGGAITIELLAHGDEPTGVDEVITLSVDQVNHPIDLTSNDDPGANDVGQDIQLAWIGRPGHQEFYYGVARMFLDGGQLTIELQGEPSGESQQVWYGLIDAGGKTSTALATLHFPTFTVPQFDVVVPDLATIEFDPVSALGLPSTYQLIGVRRGAFSNLSANYTTSAYGASVHLTAEADNTISVQSTGESTEFDRAFYFALTDGANLQFGKIEFEDDPNLPNSNPWPEAEPDLVIIPSGVFSVDIDVLANDRSNMSGVAPRLVGAALQYDWDPLVTDIVSYQDHGTLVQTDERFTFYPSGPDRSTLFNYRIENPTGKWDVGRIDIDYEHDDLFQPDEITATSRMQSQSLQVLGNDQFPDGSLVTSIVNSSAPVNKSGITAWIQNGRAMASVANGAEPGASATFSYGVTLPRPDAVPEQHWLPKEFQGGTFTIVYEPGANAIIAADDNVMLDAGAITTTIDALANDQAADLGDPISIVGVAKTADDLFRHEVVGHYGELSLENGQLSYRRTDGRSPGVDSFVYMVADEVGHRSVATITVEQADQFIVPDSVSVPFAQEVVPIDVLANDSLPSGFQLSGLSLNPIRSGIDHRVSLSTDDWSAEIVVDQVLFTRTSPNVGIRELYYSIADASGNAFGAARIEVEHFLTSAMEDSELDPSSDDSQAEPIINADLVRLEHGVAGGWLDVLSNDDPGAPGQALTINGVRSGSSGSFHSVADGELFLIDGELFFHQKSSGGTQSYQYRVINDSGIEAIGMIDVESEFVLRSDTATILAGADPVAIDVLANDQIPPSYRLAGISTSPNTSIQTSIESGGREYEIVGNQITARSDSSTVQPLRIYYHVVDPTNQYVLRASLLLDILPEDPGPRLILPSRQFNMVNDVGPLSIDILAEVHPIDPSDTLTLVSVSRNHPSLPGASVGASADGDYGTLRIQGQILEYERESLTETDTDTFWVEVADQNENTVTGSVGVRLFPAVSPVSANFPFFSSTTVLPDHFDSIAPGFQFDGVSLSESLNPDDYSTQIEDSRIRATVVGGELLIESIGDWATHNTFYVSVRDADGALYTQNRVLAQVESFGTSPAVLTDNLILFGGVDRVAIDPLANDSAGGVDDSLSFIGLHNHPHSEPTPQISISDGTYTIVDGKVVLDQEGDCCGHSFYYTVADEEGHRRSGSVDVDRSPQEVIPGNLLISAGQTTTTVVPLSDRTDFDSFEIVDVGTASNASSPIQATISVDGGILITNPVDFIGEEDFYYVFEDPEQTISYRGSFRVSVGPKSDSFAVDDHYTLEPGDLSLRIDPAMNDRDGGFGDRRSVTSITGNSQTGDPLRGYFGELTPLPDGTFRYDRFSNWRGTDEFAYTVVDGFGNQSSAKIFIDVHERIFSIPRLEIREDQREVRIDVASNPAFPSGYSPVGLVRNFDAIPDNEIELDYSVKATIVDGDVLLSAPYFQRSVHFFYAMENADGHVLFVQIQVTAVRIQWTNLARSDSLAMHSWQDVGYLDPTRNDPAGTDESGSTLVGILTDDRNLTDSVSGEFGTLTRDGDALTYERFGTGPVQTEYFWVAVVDSRGWGIASVKIVDADASPLGAPLARGTRGRVFYDTNGNGIDDDSSSLPLNGVTVLAVDREGNVVASRLTNSSGFYLMGWPEHAGPAQLLVKPPDGWGVTLRGVGDDTSLDSDFEPLSRRSDVIRAGMSLQNIGLAPDNDSNGFADVVEAHWSLQPTELGFSDQDFDQLSDLVERRLSGTLVDASDFDMDLRSDALEWSLGVNPFMSGFDINPTYDDYRELFGSHPVIQTADEQPWRLSDVVDQAIKELSLY